MIDVDNVCICTQTDTLLSNIIVYDARLGWDFGLLGDPMKGSISWKVGV